MQDVDQLFSGVVAAVAVDPDGPLAGALIVGAPGRGKTSLALQLIEHCPFRRTTMIADDAALLSRSGGFLMARAPDATRGLAEARGFGPARVRAADKVAVVVGFDFEAPLARLPDPDMRMISGVHVPFWPIVASDGAAARVRVILRSIIAGQIP